jgi:hypothetical protein
MGKWSSVTLFSLSDFQLTLTVNLDRGHLAGKADFMKINDQLSTYNFLNVTPMVKDLLFLTLSKAKVYPRLQPIKGYSHYVVAVLSSLSAKLNQTDVSLDLSVDFHQSWRWKLEQS